MARWHYRDPALLYLLPPAFALHVAEELWAGEGFPRWIGRIGGAPLPVPVFLAISAIGLTVVFLAVRSAARRVDRGWLAVAVATLLTVNGVLHLLGSMATAVYSPGMITGIVVYVPLGTLTLVRAWHQADLQDFTRGVVVGATAHAALLALVLSGLL